MRAQATFHTPNGPRRLLGDVVKVNSKTVWMRLDVNHKVVKRHVDKHHVEIH